MNLIPLLQASTIQLLRFPFSLFLMPAFWFALSETPQIDLPAAVLIFVILHLLVYPASNGYNSYMDRDTGSIGGIEIPMQPTRQLFYVTLFLDGLALLLSLFISLEFMLGIAAFILASRAYSYRGIRLKKYPLIGYLTVVLFQGCLIFYLVMKGSWAKGSLAEASQIKATGFLGFVGNLPDLAGVPILGILTAGLLIGGFYPLTQIYQHQQ